MNEVHDEVGKFTLEKETHVACVHAEVKLDHATPTNAGALLPWSTWEGSRYVIPTWATRWTVDACATSCCCSCGLGDSGEESTLPHCVMGERVPREQCPRSLCAGGPHGKRILAQGSSIAASSQGFFSRGFSPGVFPAASSCFFTGPGLNSPGGPSWTGKSIVSVAATSRGFISSLQAQG